MKLRLLGVALAISLSGLLYGCHASLSPKGDMALVRQVIEELRVAGVLVEAPIDTGGGDVYDRYAGWIAASAAPLMPICFMGYVLMKRTRTYKWAAGCKKP